ncbi:MAG TPA: DedA family protein [Candidatus Nitrosotalea sp.]|nr:DedA family protein [Candidatus Nitrosotalea sp.]
MNQLLIHLVDAYGLGAVLLLMAAESCGLPFPSEVIMPVAGILAATGHLNLVLVIGAGTVGNLAGSLLAYALAQRWGEPLLLGPGRVVGIRARHLEMADGWFERWGLWAVGVGRILPVVRTYISFPAGLARINLPAFALVTAAGALPWCAALTLVGYELGSNYERVSAPVGRVALVVALALAVVIVVWLWRGQRQEATTRA